MKVFIKIFNGISSYGYILNKSQISTLIPEGRKFTIIAQYNKTSTSTTGYKSCHLLVYPENATKCRLSGDVANGYYIYCNDDNGSIDFDVFTASNYNTTTMLDEWLPTLSIDDFTQSTKSSFAINRFDDFYCYNNMYFSTSKKLYNQDDTLEIQFNMMRL